MSKCSVENYITRHIVLTAFLSHNDHKSNDTCRNNSMFISDEFEQFPVARYSQRAQQKDTRNANLSTA